MKRLIQMAAACIVASLAGATLANAESVRRYDFEVTWSTFPDLVLATGTIALKDDGISYQMGMEARALLAVPAVDWRGFFATEGRMTPGGRAPALFRRVSQTQSREERAVIEWSEEGGAPVTDLDETGRIPGTEVVDPDSISSEAVDPLTFLAQIFDRVIETNGASCELVSLTWDGVRLAEIAVETGEKVQAARVDCILRYRSIKGLPDVRSFVAKEDSTLRVVRFEKKLGQWRPIYVTIAGEFAGFESIFTTTITPVK